MKKSLKRIYILIISLLIGIIPITVNATSISLNKNQMTLGVGYSETLKYTLTSGLNSSNIVWKSSNEKVAIVSNGKVTGVTNGETIITATINGQSSTCLVIVSPNYIAVSNVKLNKTSTTLSIGSTESLTGTVVPSNATNKDMTWTSSDNSIATVSNGKVTAKKTGTAIITVTSGNKKATCIVNVVNTISLKGISINKTTTTIKEQAAETLTITYSPSNATNKKITWKSSNTNIATVDNNGKVTAKKAGTATITAVSNDGGHVATCKVTVEAISKKVTSVTLDKKELTILTGEKANLKVTINPNYAENKNIKWETSNKSIAKVDNGEITAISPGSAEIKVITEDGEKEAICKVTVIAAPIKSITFKEEEQIVYVDTETTLKTISDPIDSVIENPIWTSSNELVATVENGIVKALSIGETTITISNEDKSITASTIIKVINKPKEKLKIEIDGYELDFDPDKTEYTLEIQNEESLTINTNIDKDKVTINGNQNLKNGSIITITIKDDEKKTYILNIKKKENMTIIFISIISVLLLLNLIRMIIKSKKKK